MQDCEYSTYIHKPFINISMAIP